GKRLRRELAEATMGLTTRLEIERAGFLAFFRFAAVHRGLYRIVRQAEFVDEPTFRRYYAELARGYAPGLERAMERGPIRRLDAEGLAYALMGMADFLGMRFVLWAREGDDVQHVLETAISFMQHGLARPASDGTPGAARKPQRKAKTKRVP